MARTSEGRAKQRAEQEAGSAEHARHRAEEEAHSAEEARGKAEAARQEALAAREKSEESLLQMKYRRGLEAIDRDQPAEALAWLAAVLRQQPAHPSAGSLIVSLLNERNFALPVGQAFSLGSQQRDLQFLPDGRLLSRAGNGVMLCDFATGLPLAGFRGSGHGPR